MIASPSDNLSSKRGPEPVKGSKRPAGRTPARTWVKFEVYGEEMVEKNVKLSSNSGRVYLPPDWVGSRVKIIKLE